MKNNHPTIPLNGNIANNVDIKNLNDWIKSDIELQIWNLETANKMNEVFNSNKNNYSKHSIRK